jgi:GTPase SAR1 family protein
VGDTDPAFGLLLCGAGESGKTTFVRQLKLLFLGGIDENHRRSLTQTIRGNLIETMQMLIVWLERNGKDIPEDLSEYSDLIAGTNAHDCEFSTDIVEALTNLWQDPLIQEAFGHRDETAIPDHMDYFFPKIDELLSDDYLPSDADLLRARIRTVGVDKVTLNIEGALIRVFDVGGQTMERNKWDANEVSGVIFCVSFVDFDKPMFEHLPQLVPRIQDALEIFGELVHKPKFQEAPFFLIGNKYDSFKQKVRDTNVFQRIFPDYTGDIHDPESCAKYLQRQFIERAQPEVAERPIVCYLQDSLNEGDVRQNVGQLCQYIRTNYFE